MKKVFFLAVAFMIAGLSSAEAAVYKGQKIYMKKCRKCHGGGQDMAASKTMSAWEELLKESGGPLADLHLNRKNAEDSWEYFESRTYSKKVKHLSEFLLEYAQDSGNVPACSD